MLSSTALMREPQHLSDRPEALRVLLDVIRSCQTCFISSHARPDGDAIGSALATMHLLQAMGKDASVFFADAVPRAFRDLPGANLIRRSVPERAQFDLGIVLECDSVARTGFSTIPCAQTINIDHHQSGRIYADLNWIEPLAPAVGVLVYELAVASGATLTPEFATCVYAALLTDTVAFTISNIEAATFDLARQLLELGADASGVTDAVYFTQRESKIRLLGAALGTMQVHGPIAWAIVTLEQVRQLGATLEDSDGIVQQLIMQEGICAAALLRELPEGGFRVSLRSRGSVNVAAVAEAFGGGGHRNASGCTLFLPAQEATHRLEVALERACLSAEPAA